MLYDPKWGTKTKPVEPTLQGFVAWLEQQPADAEYRWANCSECAIGQYLRTLGFTNTGDVSFEKYNEMEGGYSNIAVTRPWTFGAALARARAHLAK